MGQHGEKKVAAVASTRQTNTTRWCLAGLCLVCAGPRVVWERQRHKDDNDSTKHVLLLRGVSHGGGHATHDKDKQALDSPKGIQPTFFVGLLPLSRARAQAPPFVHPRQVGTSHASHTPPTDRRTGPACLTCPGPALLPLKPTSPLTQPSLPTPLLVGYTTHSTPARSPRQPPRSNQDERCVMQGVG